MNMERYEDETLSFEERAADMTAHMTLEECASQMLFGAAKVEHVGIPFYNWWNEALHGVARCGMATVFPQAIGMAAAFDAQLLKRAAEVISTEGRAKYNMYQKYEDYGIYKGITYWSPNVNIFRDPRWGRGQETYGEDPYLTGCLGAAFVEGLQGDDPRYLKTAACAKHFAVHSGPEKVRHEFDAVASPKDMEETYLPAFKRLVDCGVEGFMGAYNRTNGEPCCGSRTLLAELLRRKWGFKGYITSDCWAVSDFHLHHGVTVTPTDSVQLALENGCDLNCGNMYAYIMQAYEEGKITEEMIRTSCTRLLTTRMKLGMFDQKTPFDAIGMEVVDCEAHRAVNEEMTRASMVLLKNNGVLPLKKEMKKIAVIGPHADCARKFFGGYTHMCMMESTYAIANSIAGVSGVKCTKPEEIVTVPGTNIQSDETEEFDRILRRQKPQCRSLLEELRKKLPQAEIAYSYGYYIAGEDQRRFEDALKLVREADIVILTLG